MHSLKRVAAVTLVLAFGGVGYAHAELKTKGEGKSQKLSSIKGQMESLQELIRSMDSGEELLSTTATSSQESAVSVTSSPGAPVGSFNVEVTTLASAERTYSNAFAQKDQAGLIGTGTLTI